MKDASTHEDSNMQLQSPSFGTAANVSQPLQARSSNSGTSFKKSGNSQSSNLGAGDVSADACLGWTSTQISMKPEPGHLTSAFSQSGSSMPTSNRVGVHQKSRRSPRKPRTKALAVGQSKKSPKTAATAGTT